MATRKELVEAVRARYRSASTEREGQDPGRVRGAHRLPPQARHPGTGEAPREPSNETRPRNRLYDEAVRQALTVLWEAADRVCGKRLKALIPMLVDAMERHGHLDLDPVVKTKVLQVSAATIDRVLADAR